MGLFGLLIALLIFGLIFWAIGRIPLAEPFRTIVYVVLAIILILWLCSAFGLLTMGPVVRLR